MPATSLKKAILKDIQASKKRPTNSIKKKSGVGVVRRKKTGGGGGAGPRKRRGSGGGSKLKQKNKKRKKQTAAKRSVRRGKKQLCDILPFLQTFKELHPSQRGIMLAHLDEKSCNTLYETIANVLRNPNLSETRRKKLRGVLHPYKAAFRTLIKTTGNNAAKRKTLYKIGGFPLATVLGAAIPLLLDIVRKK